MSLIQILCQIQGAEIAHKLLVFLESADLLGTQLTQSELLPSDADVLEIMQHDATSIHKLANSLNYRMIQSFHKYLEHLVEPENRDHLKAKLSYELELNSNDARQTVYKITFYARTCRRLSSRELTGLCNDIVIFEKQYLHFGIHAHLAVTLFVPEELINQIMALNNGLKPDAHTNIVDTECLINLLKNDKRSEILNLLATCHPAWQKQLSRKEPAFLRLIVQEHSRVK